ncbi:hypothetical protein KEM55_006257 [Ascosphaera atra]|nr:hypothetical protein KEM55_006257 [Ascosphaera atra]
MVQQMPEAPASTSHLPEDRMPVLERNICFVDMTQTFNGDNRDSYSAREGADAYSDEILRYIERPPQLEARDASAPPWSDDCHSQVDVVLYLLSLDPDCKATKDLQCIKLLDKVTNVIPLIPKADMLGEAKVAEIKEWYRERAQDEGIQGVDLEEIDDTISYHHLLGSSSNVPYAVSLEPGMGGEETYSGVTRSLEGSELPDLARKLFDLENMDLLRRAAWRKLAKGKEGKEIIFASWAASLRKSLENDSMRYIEEMNARRRAEMRLLHVLPPIKEEEQGALLLRGQTGEDRQALILTATKQEQQSRAMYEDPLGLLSMNDKIKRTMAVGAGAFLWGCGTGILLGRGGGATDKGAWTEP